MSSIAATASSQAGTTSDGDASPAPRGHSKGAHRDRRHSHAREGLEAQEGPGHSQPPTEPKRRRKGAHVLDVALNSGGSVSLSIDVNPLALDETDRDFLYSLADAMRAYQNDDYGKATGPITVEATIPRTPAES